MSGKTSIEWTPALVARFWGNVWKRAETECWPWMAGCFRGGYGQFRVAKRKVKASRAAYELHNGPLPDGQIARHTCDNPPCCNPAHLIPGTHKQNSEDRVARGRSGRLPGALNPQAKLAPQQVEDLRQRARAGETYRDLGRAFGLHYNSVGRIVRGERWAS